MERGKGEVDVWDVDIDGTGITWTYGRLGSVGLGPIRKLVCVRMGNYVFRRFQRVSSVCSYFCRMSRAALRARLIP
jgi:hypothetical protein